MGLDSIRTCNKYAMLIDEEKQNIGRVHFVLQRFTKREQTKMENTTMYGERSVNFVMATKEAITHVVSLGSVKMYQMLLLLLKHIKQ